jgi:formate-dependent nitrite reductase cytochrome c552 subunit
MLIFFQYKNVEDVHSLAADMKIISDDLRTYLKNRSLKWQRKYNRNFEEWRKTANSDGSSDVCYENDCEGFPKGTRLFAMHAFYLCLRITKINGEFKIVNVYSAWYEDD